MSDHMAMQSTSDLTEVLSWSGGVCALVVALFLVQLYAHKDVTSSHRCERMPHLKFQFQIEGFNTTLQVYERGRYSRDYFRRNGELRHIKRLRFWPLDRVLVDKYRLPRDEAEALTEFLLPMLDMVPEKRATAAEMLAHPWLDGESLGEKVGSARVAYQLVAG